MAPPTLKSVMTACLLSIVLVDPSQAQSGAGTPKGAADVAWLVFVDDLHVDFRNTGLIRQFLQGLATTLMRNDDVIGMRTSGPSSIALDATSDRTAIEAAIRKVSGAGLHPREVSELLKDPTGEIDIRVAATFATASTLLEGTPGTSDRRRAMLYISNGYDTQRGRALASVFSRAAQQAQVVVFTVNAAALGPPRDSTPVSTRTSGSRWSRRGVRRSARSPKLRAAARSWTRWTSLALRHASGRRFSRAGRSRRLPPPTASLATR